MGIGTIIWTIIIGFVAGVVAKFLHPGGNEPSGFNDSDPRHRWRLRRDLSRSADRLVQGGRERGLHRVSGRRDHRARDLGRLGKAKGLGSGVSNAQSRYPF